MIEFGNDKSYRTDFVSSIPNPKRLYIRLPDTTLSDAMAIALDSNAMSIIKYSGLEFIGCTFLSITSENGVPRLTLSYTQMTKEV